MTIQDLGALGELIGSVAVLATLIYLALQTRQNTAAIGAQLDASRISTTQTNLLTTATSSELLQAMAEDRIDGDAITINPRLVAYWMAEFFTHQWNLIQGRRGILPTYNETATRRRVSDLFTTYRSVEGWWESTKPHFLPEFVELVEEQRAKGA